MKTRTMAFVGALALLAACGGKEQFITFQDRTDLLSGDQLGTFTAGSGEKIQLTKGTDGISISHQVSLADLDNTAAANSACKFQRSGKVARLLFLPYPDSTRRYYGDAEKAFAKKWPKARFILQTDLQSFTLASGEKATCPAQIEQTNSEAGQFVIGIMSYSEMMVFGSHGDVSNQKLVPNVTDSQTDFTKEKP